jgi:CIC family chloride channel protein
LKSYSIILLPPPRGAARDEADYKIVEAAGAGAGLAVAFNAPIGGSVFVFEELTSSFTPWLLIATLAATSIATWTIRLMLGNTLDFKVNSITLRDAWMISPFFALGLLLGATGVLYNYVTLAALRLSDHVGRISSVYKAASIEASRGGDPLTQAILSESHAIEALLTVFLLRFLMGLWSYAAGTPGGLFAPILVLGASFGALFAAVVNHFIPVLGLSAVACALVGMAALFSACVRAPLTGIVLAVEMTGRGDLALGLLAGSLGAMVVAMLLRSEPIYDSLKRRMLQEEEASAAKASGLQRL